MFRSPKEGHPRNTNCRLSVLCRIIVLSHHGQGFCQVRRDDHNVAMLRDAKRDTLAVLAATHKVCIAGRAHQTQRTFGLEDVPSPRNSSKS